jgi:DNA-directed RNA polymerase specialized sigma24 family protein
MRCRRRLRPRCASAARFRREGPLEAWVWRIVLNAARSDARRSIPAVGYGEAAAANGHLERDAELRVALARLPERQRTAHED